VGGFFNLSNITGSSFADWHNTGGRNSPEAKHARTTAVACEQPMITNREIDSMGTRSDIRAALNNGRVSYTKLKELLPGKNIATPLSQMSGEGQLTKSVEDGETFYALGREPGRASGKRNKTGVKSRLTKPGTKAKSGPKKRTPAKLAFKFKKSAGNATPAPGSAALQQFLTQLRLRRDLIDNAIAALEQLPA